MPEAGSKARVRAKGDTPSEIETTKVRGGDTV